MLAAYPVAERVSRLRRCHSRLPLRPRRPRWVTVDPAADLGERLVRQPHQVKQSTISLGLSLPVDHGG